MKLERMEEAGLRPAPPRAWSATHSWLCVLLGALATAALIADAALAWRAHAAPLLDPGPPGRWYSVQLVSGQVYYGVLLEARPGFVKLGDVYYTQAYTQPDGQPGNRVVNRAKTDWHGPSAQLIPAEKILMMEAVGEQSPLARLIAQDQAKK
ncbi:hypothetical protein JOD97_002457 [Duganella sp. 1411]|jgi:hypothetical protein|uniref:hypothetical protein n=1 Tax=Duganella sp. 1411 TaxID=2806572 RepID=UPI001AE37ABF|nr:hypothetical protein [Duganella sp. 1411]MBP1204415.1 hypothetical protein [Duganella sp. 1411]